MAWEQIFDEEIADFDAVTPTWDGEVDAVGDFDAETDVDNDLNDHADAAHDGAVGLEFTFDDANVMYGRINADAIDQTSVVVSFWFDPNTVAVEAGKIVFLLAGVDGAAGNPFYLWLYPDNHIVFWYLDDAAGAHQAAVSGVLTGYTNIKIMWQASSGVGNDDGFMRVYIDDVYLDGDTGIDNDTKDWDYIIIGQIWTNSTTFGGSFYIDTIKVDPVGAPFVDKLAAKNGTYGLAIPIMDATLRYCSFTGPTNETIVTIECGIDINTITMGTNAPFRVMVGDALIAATYLRYDGSDYQFLLFQTDDNGQTSQIGAAVTDGWHQLRIVWAQSSGADDGYIYLYVDGVLYASLTELDNDTKTIGTIYFGAYGSIDAGTYGIIYMDNCQWDDAGQFLVSEAGALTTAGGFARTIPPRSFTGALTTIGGFVRTLPSRSFTGALTPAGTVVKKIAKSLAGTLTPSGTVTKKISKAFTGALSLAGNLVQRLDELLTIYFRKTGSGPIEFIQTNDSGVIRFTKIPSDGIEEE